MDSLQVLEQKDSLLKKLTEVEAENSVCFFFHGIITIKIKIYYFITSLINNHQYVQYMV